MSKETLSYGVGMLRMGTHETDAHALDTLIQERKPAVFVYGVEMFGACHA